MKENNTLQLILKGFIIGSSMSVPGVSGGTMAIILGIYDRMIQAVSSFFKDIKGNMLFLLKVAVGGVLGIGSLSFVIQWLLEKIPIPVSFFFVGAVVGGIPIIGKKIFENESEKKLKAKQVICFLAGFAMVIAISFLPKGLMQVRMDLSVEALIFWAITGVVVALALVLPGISTSHMLLVLGLYQTTLAAISEFDIAFLMCLAVSIVIGVFLTTKPLEWLMNTYTSATYSGILGFVIGSLSAIFKEIVLPAISKTPNVLWLIGTIAGSVVLFVVGVLFIRKLER